MDNEYDELNEFNEESFDKKQSMKVLIRLLKEVKPVWGAFGVIIIFMIILAMGDAYFFVAQQRIIDNGVSPYILLQNTYEAKNQLLESSDNIVTYNSDNIFYDDMANYKAIYRNKIWVEVIVFFIVWFIVAFCVYGFIRLAGISQEKIMYMMRKKVFNHLQKLSLSYFDKTPVGWIMARVTSDIEKFSEMLAWFLVDAVWGFSVVLFYSIVMFVVNWKLALLVVGSVPVLWVITYYFQYKILKAQRESRKYNSETTRKYNEGINGVKVIKSMLQQDRMYKEFGENNQKLYKATYKAGLYSAVYIPLVILVSSIVLTGVLIFGGNLYIVGTGITIGVLSLFFNYAVNFFEPLNQLAIIFSEFQRSLASAERVFSLLDTKPEIIDDDNIETKEFTNIEGNIIFKNVEFAYEKDKTILKNFNLEIKKGEVIALVGPTGAGKSTIINLICRFYEPTNGVILIDGEDYKTKTMHSLQSQLGVVLQTPYIFSGTIKENIKYGKLDATDEEVRYAAELVSANKFIEKLPRKYDEEVGEGGNLLSTGQKQLISFARAVIRNPQIFIMDEATASVDTLTEQLIQEGLNNVLENRTSIIIAHRLSTIKKADTIIVLKDGTIEEMGNHRELLLRKGHYYKLYTKQLREEKEQELGLVAPLKNE